KRNWLFRIIKLLYKKALKNAQEVWFLNNEDARVFVKEKIVSIVKMKVLAGEGVNTEHFAPRHDRATAGDRPFQFIMSTRLLKSKGISLYADAARILRRKHYPAVFNLIGFFEAGHPDSIDPAML